MSSQYIFPIALPSALAILNSNQLFPVRRIWCVARNYAAHAREMGSDPAREPPCFFAKPSDALVSGGGTIPYPPATSDFHYEAELVVAIGREGVKIPMKHALDHVFGYGVGIDLTRRDLQTTARAAGQPWDMAKGFDLSAPCSALKLVNQCGHPDKGAVTLSVNGSLRQNGDLSDMIWPVADIIEQLSKLVTLAPGDLIFTGTPEGVGPLKRGDHVAAAISGVGTVEISIT